MRCGRRNCAFPLDAPGKAERLQMKMNQLPRDEKGAILIWAAVGLLAVLIAFAGLATDIPYLYVARRQAQTAADAGALSGAYGLLSGPGQAVADATAIAVKTPIIGQFLTPGEVEVFTCDSNGGAIDQCLQTSANPDQVTCNTYRVRDVAHGNRPMPLFLMPILQLQLFGLGRATATSSGWDAANVSATATARLSSSCGGECFKPWSIADRWHEKNGNGTFDPGVDLYIPDGQIGPSGEPPSGYSYPADNGLQVTLKVGSPSATISSGFFYAVDFPPLNRGTPVTGGNTYNDNIATCGPGSFVAIDDQLQVEPGNMVGPTKKGAEDLIALDLNAVWDSTCNCVNSPLGISSPRMIRIGFFDPRVPVVSGRNYVTVIKVGGFFIEGVQSNGDVTGRYTQVLAFGGPPDPNCSFLKTVQLVK